MSEIVAVRRLVDLGLIDRENFFTFYREYSDRIRMALPQRSGGDFYAVQNQRIGRNFAKAVIRATREGKLLFSEAYRLTGLHGKTFEQYAETLGYAGTR